MEPFDELLNHQVYALEEERMAWEKTIGEHRRNGPSDVRTLMEGMLIHERGIEYRHSASAGSPTDDLGLDLQRMFYLVFCDCTLTWKVLLLHLQRCCQTSRKSRRRMRGR